MLNNEQKTHESYNQGHNSSSNTTTGAREGTTEEYRDDVIQLVKMTNDHRFIKQIYTILYQRIMRDIQSTHTDAKQ